MKTVQLQRYCDGCRVLMSPGSPVDVPPGQSVTVVGEGPEYCSQCSSVPIDEYNEWVCLGALSGTDVILEPTGDGKHEIRWRTCFGHGAKS